MFLNSLSFLLFLIRWPGKSKLCQQSYISLPTSFDSHLSNGLVASNLLLTGPRNCSSTTFYCALVIRKTASKWKWILVVTPGRWYLLLHLLLLSACSYNLTLVCVPCQTACLQRDRNSVQLVTILGGGVLVTELRMVMLMVAIVRCRIILAYCV